MLTSLGAAALGARGLAGARGTGAVACRAPGELCQGNANCCVRLCAADATGRRVCACPAPTVACGRACVDPAAAYQSDPANCGGCGTRCPRTRCQVAGAVGAHGDLAPDPAANGLACDDGSLCTTGDRCQDGACVGTKVDCGRLDGPCMWGVCNPQTGGCEAQNAPNGTACDDGNPCTQTDTCQGGTCVGGNPVVCTASDQCHAAGVCDTTTGQCTNPAKPDGTACTDEDACTQTDTYQAGVCTGANPVVCAAPDQCHQAGVCNGATGTCDYAPVADGTPCDDGDKCTVGDTCVAGTCTPGPATRCAASDQCHNVGTCNPATGVCSNPAKPDGTACNDGNACTQTDTCQGGVCVGRNPVVCAASDQCHVAGACDPATGMCSNPEATDGTACNDGNLCTSGDHCVHGACTGTPVDCTAPNATATCNPTTGQCQVTACNDGYANCDGDPSTGCESNLQSDPNCGACGHKCSNLGTTCVAGVCHCGDTPCACGCAVSTEGVHSCTELTDTLCATNCTSSSQCPGDHPVCYVTIAGIQPCGHPACGTEPATCRD
jgi:hypothetical protein